MILLYCTLRMEPDWELHFDRAATKFHGVGCVKRNCSNNNNIVKKVYSERLIRRISPYFFYVTTLTK